MSHVVRDQLNSLPLSVLLAFAEKQNFPVAKIPSREDLIDGILALTENEVSPLLNTPTRFEIVELLKTLHAECDESTQASLDRMEARSTEKAELRYRGIEQLKWLFAAVGASITVLIALSTGLGVRQFIQHAGIQESYERTTEEYARMQKGLGIGVQSRWISTIALMMNDARLLMDNMSISGPSDLDLTKAAYQQRILEEILALSANSKEVLQEAPNGEALLMLELLRGVYGAIRELPRIRDPSQDAYMAELEAMKSQWEKLVVPEFAGGSLFELFADQMSAWRSNVLGTIELTRHRIVSGNEKHQTLNQARRQFEVSILKDPYFARPYSNLGMLEKRVFDLEKKDVTKLGRTVAAGYLRAQLARLDKAQEYLERSRDYAETGASLSLTHNNSAYYYLIEADLVETAMQAGQDTLDRTVDRALQRAKEHIKAAQSSYPVQPVAHTTAAEIRLFEIGRSTPVDEEARKAFAEIISLLRKAVDGGYTAMSGVEISELTGITPVYANLGKLGVTDWEEELLAALKPQWKR